MRVSITPHPSRDGWYYLSYRPGGTKGKREREPVKGYDKACMRRDELEASHARPAAVAHPTLKEVYKEYLAWVKREQSPDTYRNKTYAFTKRIIPHFGNYRVRDLTQRIYDGFQEKYRGRRRAIILYQDYLGAMIKWMVKRNLAEPLTFTPEKPKYHLPSHSIADVTDLDRFIAAVDYDHTVKWAKDYEAKLRNENEAKRMILTTMLWTGLRWNEVINLRWEDVNLNRGEIIVKESEQEEQATVRIAPDMADWYRSNKKFSGWIFVNPATITRKNPGGNHYTTLKTIMAGACKKTGVSITPHDIRRISAMMVYEATDGDLLSVQRHLRHKDIKTTIRYLECSGVRIHQAHQKMVQHIAAKRAENGQK